MGAGGASPLQIAFRMNRSRHEQCSADHNARRRCGKRFRDQAIEHHSTQSWNWCALSRRTQNQLVGENLPADLRKSEVASLALRKPGVFFSQHPGNIPYSRASDATSKLSLTAAD